MQTVGVILKFKHYCLLQRYDKLRVKAYTTRMANHKNYSEKLQMNQQS